MSDLASAGHHDLMAHPTLIRPRIEQAQNIAAIAARMHRWEELDQAVGVIIQCQQAAVAWWHEHVRPAGQGIVGGSATMPAGVAEDIIELRKDQISRFGSALKDEVAYHERLVRRARREAGLEAASEDPSALRPTPGRDGPDFWPTPHSLVAALVHAVLPLLRDDVPIFECAAGDRRLAIAMRAAGRDVIESDLYPQDGLCEPRDFLAEPPPVPDTIVVTNPPFHSSDAFIRRGLSLLEQGATSGLVLLLRHDHLQAGSRVDAFNRATFEVHCNWRPIWIEGTEGQPRWSFHWVGWTDGPRRPPLYLAEAPA